MITQCNLPSNWSISSLESLIVHAIGGDWGKLDNSSEGDLIKALCIRGSEFRNWDRLKGATASSRWIKNKSLESRRLYENDILVEISGGGPEQPVGRTVLIDKACLSSNPETPKVPTNFLRLIRPTALVSSQYLNSYLGYFYKSGEIVKYQAGSNNLRNLKFVDYLGIGLPIPPFNEQHRIVTKIEELFSELDKGIESLKTAREQLKVYRQALLKHAFEGKLTEQWRKDNEDKLETAEELLARIKQERETRYQQQLEEWKQAVKQWETGKKEEKKPPKPKTLNAIIPLSNDQLPLNWVRLSVIDCLLDSPTNGRSVKDRQTGFPVLRLTALKQPQLDLSAYKLGDWERDEAERYIIEEGDFLLSRGNGSKRLVGLGRLVPKMNFEVAYPDTIVRLKPAISYVENEYFAQLWNSNVIRQQIEKSARTTAGIYKINQTHISNFQLPICSLEEQREIISQLSEKVTTLDRMEFELNDSLQKSEALRQSILKKAFSGQLVPQNPNDEPASALLARIATERAAAEVKAKTEKAEKAKRAKLAKKKD